jgi:hypothetical protein
MKIYAWRKNFTAILSDQNQIIRGKLAFKTKETHWLSTEAPVIVLVSIHSEFHEAINGDLKMNALLSIIKSHVKGKIAVLLSDSAHIQTTSLHFQGNLDQTYEECLKEAQKLSERYAPYFNDCKVVYWHSYINQDPEFNVFKNLLKQLFQADSVFREHVQNDAIATYTTTRMQMFSNKTLFIEKAIEDILDQCVCLLVLSRKGYRYKFYPGNPNVSMEYVNRIFLPKEEQISWIDVFLTIEKKSKMKID